MSARGNSQVASLPVSCRARGHSMTGRVHDLTRDRCLLDLGNGFLIAGDNVALRFDSGVRVTGRVMVIHGRIARVEFEQPLHEAICEHLAVGGARWAPSFDQRFSREPRVTGSARRLG